MTQTVNGYAFPDDVDINPDLWFRFKDEQGNETQLYGKELLVDIAHQKGLESIEVEPAMSGDRGVGQGETVPWCAVKATVTIDGVEWTATGSTDSTTNSLEDMVSTAASRAVKRAIEYAFNIHSVDETEDLDAQQQSGPNDPRRSRSGGSVEVGDDGEVEVTPPDDHEKQGPDTDDDLEW